jgi:hypothetical protein
LAGGHYRELMQLGGDVGAVGIGFSGGQTLAQLNNLFFAGTTPANLGPAAGCGHAVLLNFLIELKRLNLSSHPRTDAYLIQSDRGATVNSAIPTFTLRVQSGGTEAVSQLAIDET